MLCSRRGTTRVKKARSSPSKRLKRSAVPSAPIGVFDDALPERLHPIAPAGEEQKVSVYRGSSAQLSPYIIRLSRGEHVAQPLEVPSMEALAASLIIDGTDEDDAVPLTVRESHHDGVAAQLREGDIVLDLPVLDDVLQLEADVPDELILPTNLPIGAISLQELNEFVVSDIEEQARAEEAAQVIPAVAEPPHISFTEELQEIEAEPISPASWSLRAVFTFPHAWQRALAAFTGLAMLLVMPMHALQSFAEVREEGDALTEVGRSAIDDLTRGASALADQRFDLAGDEFSRAAAKFADAEAQLGDMHAAIVAVVNVIPQTDRTYDSVHGLITAGRELATVASMLSAIAEKVGGQGAIDIVTKLELLTTAMESAAPHGDAAGAALEKVDASVIPEEYRDRVAALKEYAPQLTDALREFVTFSNTMSTMLGGDGAMRYLVAFQNTTELRPTGGFIGSFAEMKVRNGAIESMVIPGGGTYDVQGQLTEFVAAPNPLQLLKARWEMQDANWFPDFPTSAKKFQWFYEHAGGPTTDGVIAINSNFVVELLAALGPVEMPEYGRTIDAENFMFEAQKIVELEYDKEENAPKAFIGDLAPVLLERITQADLPTFLAVLDIVGEALQEKDIQIFLTNNALQASIEELGWSGSMKRTSGDYLMVVNTNLGGGKTDAVIEQAVDVDVQIAEDGSVVNTVRITKTHHGLANALFSGRNNVDYIRLYVPEGSELLSAEGFEIPGAELFEAPDTALAMDEELAMAMTNITADVASGTDIWDEKGKTVFGNWIQTAPGETEEVTFTYRLPFTVFAPEKDGLIAKAKAQLGMGQLGAYTLFIQKQPGVTTRTTTVTVETGEELSAVWTSDQELVTGSLAGDNSKDAFYRMLFERK